MTTTTLLSHDPIWDAVANAATARDYVAAYNAVAALHLALKRNCATSECGGLATKDSNRCSLCWRRSAAGKAHLRAVVADTLVSIAPTLAALDTPVVVATVNAEEAPQLPDGVGHE